MTSVPAFARIEELGDELERRHDLIHEIVDKLPWGIVVVDRNGNIEIWNSAATRLSGGSPGRLAEDECAIQFKSQYPQRQDTAPPHELPLVQSLEGKVVHNYRATVGNKLLEVASTPLNDGAVCVFKEVHDATIQST